jgi:predicted nucleic acid-binding protein
MTYLCDTNIISELARRHPNRGVVEWAQGVSSIALSVITLEEIFFGLAWKPNASVRQWFQSFFDQYCELLPVTAQIASRCGQLRGELRREGRTLSQADTLIAATAELHQLTLVTRNIRDFQSLRIPLLNPFL